MNWIRSWLLGFLLFPCPFVCAAFSFDFEPENSCIGDTVLIKVVSEGVNDMVWMSNVQGGFIKHSADTVLFVPMVYDDFFAPKRVVVKITANAYKKDTATVITKKVVLSSKPVFNFIYDLNECSSWSLPDSIVFQRCYLPGYIDLDVQPMPGMPFYLKGIWLDDKKLARPSRIEVDSNKSGVITILAQNKEGCSTKNLIHYEVVDKSFWFDNRAATDDVIITIPGPIELVSREGSPFIFKVYNESGVFVCQRKNYRTHHCEYYKLSSGIYLISVVFADGSSIVKKIYVP
ncbi:hypothetical protein GC194_09125 [bacterium]|nr:hypothetical protein [bacterium]